MRESLQQLQEFKFPKQNGKMYLGKMISVDRVFHTSPNLHQMIMVIILIKDLRNTKTCKVIVRYLAEISQLMLLTISGKLHIC